METYTSKQSFFSLKIGLVYSKCHAREARRRVRREKKTDCDQLDRPSKTPGAESTEISRGYVINREQHIDHKDFLEIRKFEAKDHKGSWLWLESLDSESCEDYKEQRLARHNIMP